MACGEEKAEGGAGGHAELKAGVHPKTTIGLHRTAFSALPPPESPLAPSFPPPPLPFPFKTCSLILRLSTALQLPASASGGDPLFLVPCEAVFFPSDTKPPFVFCCCV